MAHCYFGHCLILAVMLICYSHEAAGYEILRYPPTAAASRYPWRDLPLKRTNYISLLEEAKDGEDLIGPPIPSDYTPLIPQKETGSDNDLYNGSKKSWKATLPHYNAPVGYEGKVIYVPVAVTRAWLPTL